MMLGLGGLRGMGGIQTCDMVVDGNGIAVDCGSVWNILHSACWNPLAPCAATGAVDGQPTTIDCSKSQLGTVGCTALEQQGTGAGGNGLGFITTPILIGAAIIGGLLLFDALKY